MLKRVLIGLGVVVALAGVLVVMLVRGTLGLDDWVVRQVVAISEAYIVPTIAFDSFDYQSPRTVFLEGATFTAPDGTEVITCRELKLTLAQIPRRGQPIVIERIALTDPVIRLVRDPDSDGVDFKGLVPFVRTNSIRDQSSVSENVRLSSVLEIRELIMTNGGFIYDESDGSPPMHVEGLTLDMEIDPTAIDSDDPGWYQLDTEVTGLKVLDIEIDGRINLDTLEAYLTDVFVRGDLNKESLRVLPPSIQSLLREHDARGRFAARLAGYLNLKDIVQSELDLTVSLTEFNFATGEYRYPIAQADIAATIDDGMFMVERAEMRTLNGSVRLLHTWVDLTCETKHAEAAWEGIDLDLQKLLRIKATTGVPPAFAGIVQTNGQVFIDLALGMDSIHGNGEVHLRNGRVINGPVMRSLLSAMNLVGRIKGSTSLRDQGDVYFNFTPDGIEITQGDVRTSIVAARGRGTIGYDQSLDLRINAGPLERIRGLLGKAGRVLGNITDKLMTYRVTGTLDKPKVRVVAGG